MQFAAAGPSARRGLVAATNGTPRSHIGRRSAHRFRWRRARPPARIGAVVVLIAAAGLTAGVSGCGFPNRLGAANSIGDTIRAMPGVNAADVHYDTSFDGGAHFNLEVTLADTASAPQAAAVGRTFVDRMRAANFAEFDVKLEVAYKANHDPDSSVPGSRAEFDYHFDRRARGGPSSGDVADSLAMWLQVAQSPVSVGATLIQPAWGGPDTSRSISVALAPSVSDAGIAGLIHAHPDLTTATWILNIPSSQRFAPPRAYQVRGPFPDQHRRALWQQIVDQIGSRDAAQASTDTIDTHAGVPSTRVEVDVDSGPDEPQRFDHIAHVVIPLLPGLGLPVGLRMLGHLDQIEFTLGGCDRPDPHHTPSPLENELRRQYQHC